MWRLTLVLVLIGCTVTRPEPIRSSAPEAPSSDLDDLARLAEVVRCAQEWDAATDPLERERWRDRWLAAGEELRRYRERR